MEFISTKYKNLRVVLAAQTHIIVDGHRMPGSHSKDFPSGKTVQFEKGVYTTNDPKEIQALKEHTDYGYRFFSSDEDRVTPKDEAIRKHNEKAEYTQKVADTGDDEESELKVNKKK